MQFPRKHIKLIGVAASCVAIGAGASVIANAGAAPSTTAHAAHAHKAHAGMGPRRLLTRAVHADLVVHTKTGWGTVTLDRGAVKSVSGQQLTITEGTMKATYKTVTLTIPTTAKVRDDKHKATLADLKAGQRVIVVQAPKRTLVAAHDPKKKS